MTNENIIPFSNEAEIALLNTIIIDNETWIKIENIIDSEDFYKEKNRIIFETIKSLVNKNDPVDLITLENELIKNNKLKLIGGKKYLNDILKIKYNIKNIKTYTKIIKEQSIIRKLILENKRIIELAINNKVKVKELINIAEKSISNISKKYENTDNLNDINYILTKTIKKIETLFKSNSKITGLSSGFKDLDNMTSGLQNGELIIVAGRPSMGKTAFAINIIENTILNSNLPVIMFSMEMSSEQIITRLLSSLSKIELQRLKSGMLKDTDWPKLSKSISLLSGKKLYIDESGTMTPNEIKNKIKKFYKKNNNLGLIVIDYLQLIKIPYLNNKTNEISEISRFLKALAKDFKIPVISLSQLNRCVEQRIDKKPLMSDLRESGAIEQDADLIIFIYRDEIYNINSRNKGIAEIIISKQRNGPVGNFNLNFFGQYSKFENIFNN